MTPRVPRTLTPSLMQSFREVSFNSNLTLIVEVKEIKVNKKKGTIAVTTLGWCPVPIFVADKGKKSGTTADKCVNNCKISCFVASHPCIAIADMWLKARFWSHF